MIKLSPSRTKTAKTKKAASAAKPAVVKAAAAKPVVKAPAPTPADFAIGQKWQLEVGYAEVVHIGKVLIDYRYYRIPNQKRVGIETKTLREFAEALKKNKAKLMA